MQAPTPLLLAIGGALCVPGVARAGETCDSWGIIAPTEVTVSPGQTAAFRIRAASADCGESDTCSWWVDEIGEGSLDVEQGASVVWTAPEDASSLTDCVPLSFSIYAQCADGDTLDSAVITLVCSEEDKLRERAGDPDTSLTGGGCQSAQLGEALMVFPLFGLGWVHRRRC